MAVSGVGGIGGAANLSQLAQLYRQQLLAGDPTTGAAGAAAAASRLAATDPAAAGRGSDFAGAVTRSLQGVESLDKTAQGKAIQAATGNLSDVQDYVIAANQAQLATELTTTVRNKAVEAFNEIMRMPL